ncbi:MAG: extradiol dioxygenase [Desulfuromonadales bacterium C00003096]|jgi:catechol 2,3-dioxygenase-like lactoylglutathione lyase family enzyme|nr:MAG: extradiol dioxygenase [Desulfuromonadales bacterium C00003096]
MTTTGKKACLVGINHVALEVGNIEAALDFHGAIFTFSLRGRSATMAFLDMGDQFIALSEGRNQAPDDHRHLGLVVDDRAAVKRALKTLGAKIVPSRGLDFLDPWGNHIQVVEYQNIQFSKTDQVLEGMGLNDLQKNKQALQELRDKGLTPATKDTNM